MAEANAPKSLITNSPFERPEKHWSQDSGGGALEIVGGRRPAGYEIFDIRNNTRRVEELELVNRIRPRVKEWREASYPGVTIVTRRLLEHWNDAEARDRRFYFCQIEAIAASLVKTPRVVVRGDALPDAKTYRPKPYHLYGQPEVKDDLNRKDAKPHEPLPELVQNAYALLGYDWRETANLLEKKQEDQLRAIVDNVGKPNTPGQHLQNVISVAMLAEGWDAANVTHIMGLRAFTSQLLCEQVISRGLRRVSYETDQDGLFRPEFVNVFGVPLSVFQDVSEEGEAPPPPKPSVQVRVVLDRQACEIRWPNILRVDTLLAEELVLDWEQVEPLEINPSETTLSAEVAPALAGYTDLEDLSAIDLEQAASEFRFQSLLFRSARKLFLQHQELSPVAGSRYSSSGWPRRS